MIETYGGRVATDHCRVRVSRALIVFCMLMLSLAYTSLTLSGSWDFLLKDPGLIRLTVTSRAVIYADAIGPSSPALSLPDDWRDADVRSNAWRYSFVFELPERLLLDQEVYLPQIADSAKIIINGQPQPYLGQLGDKPDFHWDVPLLFPVKAELLHQGRNELMVDVYANEAMLGSLSAVSIGARGSFDAHKFAVFASKRGLAYVLVGIDFFALFAFSVYAAAVSGRFYAVGVGICVSLLGCLLLHIIRGPVISVAMLFSITLASYILLMNFIIYMSSMMFTIDRHLLKVVYTFNGINIAIHLLLPVFVPDYPQLQQYMMFSSLLVLLTGVVSTWLLLKQFFQEGEAAIALMLFFGIFISTLGSRDLMVLWGWLPSYHGFYLLHSVAVLAFCLIGVFSLRIREGSRERLVYDKSMREALSETRRAIYRSRQSASEFSLDLLVSRIATTYSHEFRNPLAAALATTNTLRFERWGTSADLALRRIDDSIASITEALNQQFDFHRAMQSPDLCPTHRTLPEWLRFANDYPSCKIVWLSDPSNFPSDDDSCVQSWLQPFLEQFEKIPCVCLAQMQEQVVILHLYLHLNASDLIDGRGIAEGLLKHLKPERVRDVGEGHYLYWQHAIS